MAQDPGVKLSQHQETGVLLPQAVNVTLTDSVVRWESLTPGTAGPSPQPGITAPCSRVCPPAAAVRGSRGPVFLLSQLPPLRPIAL